MIRATQEATQEATNETLVIRYQAGDAAALTELVERNQGLVWQAALRYFTDENDVQDAVQEGNLCLMNCARCFDPEREFRFSTYATQALKMRLYRLRHKNRLIPLPYSFRGSWEDVPLQVADEDLFLEHLIAGGESPAEAVEAADEREHLRRKLRGKINRLSPRHRKVIRDRLKGRTLEDISRELGVSKERVRQIESDAIKAMRGRRKG